MHPKKRPTLYQMMVDVSKANGLAGDDWKEDKQ